MITLHLNDQIIKSLSRPELNILKYAYENTDELMELSIQDLSNRVSYSPATVLRFCKKLGYSGFSEFKYALRAEQRRKGEDISSHSSRNFSTGMMIDTLTSNIQATSKLIQEEQLNQTFRYLESGCPIYLWSPGGLTSVAVEYFEKLLLSIGRQEVYFIESVKMFEHILRNCSQESLLILISTSGKYPTTIRLGKIANASGIPILSISPLHQQRGCGLGGCQLPFFHQPTGKPRSRVHIPASYLFCHQHHYPMLSAPSDSGMRQSGGPERCSHYLKKPISSH